MKQKTLNGVFLITLGLVLFLSYFYFLITRYFRNLDLYYVFLVPLTIPTFYFFIYMNWLGMKYFKHN